MSKLHCFSYVILFFSAFLVISGVLLYFLFPIIFKQLLLSEIIIDSVVNINIIFYI